MDGKIAVVLLSGLLFACVQAPPPQAAAPEPPPPMVQAAPPPLPEPVPERIVNIRAATCARYLELSDEDRAAATMFYIGYQASRAGARTVSVGALPGIADRATSYCTSYPERPVALAFASSYPAYRRARR